MKPVLSSVKEYTAWWNEISISKKQNLTQKSMVISLGVMYGAQGVGLRRLLQGFASCAVSCTMNSGGLLPLGSPSSQLLRTREALPV